MVLLTCSTWPKQSEKGSIKEEAWAADLDLQSLSPSLMLFLGRLSGILRVCRGILAARCRS